MLSKKISLHLTRNQIRMKRFQSSDVTFSMFGYNVFICVITFSIFSSLFHILCVQCEGPGFQYYKKGFLHCFMVFPSLQQLVMSCSVANTSLSHSFQFAIRYHHSFAVGFFSCLSGRLLAKRYCRGYRDYLRV